MILFDIGMPTGMIQFDTAPELNWHAILNQIANHNKLEELISTVLYDFPDNIYLKSFFTQDYTTVAQSYTFKVNDVKKLQDKFKTLVAQNKIIEVLEELRQPSLSSKLYPEFNSTVIAVFAKYNAYQSDKIKGILNQEEKAILLATIVSNLLSLVDQISSNIIND